MFNGSNWDRKSHLSGILTEPLNPREWGWSNRPRIRPGTVQSLNAPWELS